MTLTCQPATVPPGVRVSTVHACGAYASDPASSTLD